MVNRPEADVGVELCLPLHVTGELLVHGVVHDDEERVVALVVVGVEARVRVLSRAQHLTDARQAIISVIASYTRLMQYEALVGSILHACIS